MRCVNFKLDRRMKWRGIMSMIGRWGIIIKKLRKWWRISHSSHFWEQNIYFWLIDGTLFQPNKAVGYFSVPFLWNTPTNIKLLKQCIKQLVNDKIMEFVSRNFKLLFLCLQVCEYMHCIREMCFFFFETVNRCKFFSWQHTGVKLKKSQVKQRNLT